MVTTIIVESDVIDEERKEVLVQQQLGVVIAVKEVCGIRQTI